MNALTRRIVQNRRPLYQSFWSRKVVHAGPLQDRLCEANPANCWLVDIQSSHRIRNAGHITSIPSSFACSRLFFTSSQPEKQHSERRLIGYSPEQIFDVVIAVEQYKDFLPWCEGSRIIRKFNGGVEAELSVGFKVFTESYTSRVTFQRPVKVTSSVSDSNLFTHLDSSWTFRPGPSPNTCWLEFKVNFGFKSALYREVASLVFEEVMQHMVAAFESRCQHTYGASTINRNRPRI
ncbi:hypothetical protein CYMTET_38008 [Cymbomonas tetramitiformis]|uniref:Coenzyme Q-binding protein COQ10 START domain-containing protein n=1 Tax=Cymbomonas tetramitiformis TaxID=36881 RepID=A0AAE0CCU0_9CHLO|nr:hypothetical protein CYMTET_38008 [Cymbomonas tetramitiformis]